MTNVKRDDVSLALFSLTPTVWRPVQNVVSAAGQGRVF